MVHNSIYREHCNLHKIGKALAACLRPRGAPARTTHSSVAPKPHGSGGDKGTIFSPAIMAMTELMGTMAMTYYSRQGI